MSCHQQAARGDLAGFPAITECKACHVQMSDRKIPSRRVYEIPDFVFFSHGRHAAANVECKTCHGEIMQQDRVELQQAVKMKWCVDCHKSSKAPATCTTCHELGQ